MNKYELTDVSGSSAVGEAATDKKMNGGCYVKATTGVIIALLAVIMALGVGLIVHFAENRSLDCNINQPSDPAAQKIKAGGGASATPCPTPAPCSKCTSAHVATDLLPTSQSTPGPEVMQHDVRLPGSVVPTHYTLKIQPEMYNNDVSTFTFHGSVVITVECKEATDTITLHAQMLEITEGSIVFSQTSGSGSAPTFVSYTEDKDRDFLLIHLSGKTTPGHTYTLKMDFQGPLKDDLYGLYLSSYMSANQTVYCAVTQFEPTSARKAFPCFDDPAMKATFQLTIVRKSHLMSLSNMPIQRTVPIADNYVEDVYGVSEKMSTYLLAYVVGKFDNVTAQIRSNLTYGAWARPESVNQAKFALSVGTRVISYYEEYFGIGFPLPKQDMIALPDFGAGAMENWGLITYREVYMLYQPGTTSERARQKIVAVIAHELSHQWFGDLVTMDWWDDIWLNEGFARFVQHLGADKLYPEWKMFEQFVTDAIHVAFDADSLVTSHPVYVPIRSPKDIGEVFDSISYEKGASIIRMMRFFLGEETFKNGLTRYLKQHKYGNANHTDLWKALAEQSAADGSNIDVAGIMDTWTLQMNYPVVTVTKQGGKLRIQQDRFLSNPDSTDPMTYTSSFGYSWKIPFTFTTSQAADKQANSSQIYWLMDKTLDISASVGTEDWILGNVQQYGYYRVQYEDSNWAALINQLKTNHKVLWPVNRAQIINDAWSLSRAGQLSTLTALQTLEYLDKELDYVPWRAATRQMAYVDNMLKRSALYGKYQNFLKTKVANPFQHFGIDSTNSSHLDTLTRSAIVQIACSQGLPECILQSKNLFKQWMEQPTRNNIEPDIRATVYCTAVAEGGTEEWDFVYQQYLKATVITEKSALSAALACTRTPWQLNRYLEMSITPSIVRKQDIVSVLVYISDNPIGQPLAWDFFRDKWDYLYKEYGFSLCKKILTGITRSLNTEFELSQLNNLKTEHPGTLTQSRAFQQAVEKTQTNIKWMKANTATLSKWLTSVGVTHEQRVTDVRLPDHLMPVHYELTLKPNMYGNDEEQFNFEGFVKIHMTARGPGMNVTLHANKLDILESSIRFGATGGGSGPKYNNQRQTDKDRQFEIFFLDADVVKGADYTIEMNFTGPLTGDLAGLYLSQYKSNNVTKYIATTQFEATDARKAFPCFDEPQLKATFAVKLIRKAHMNTISNMPIIKNESIADDFVIDTHNVSAKMSTYLLAFVVSEFEYTSAYTSRGVLYRAWARPEYVNQTAVALDAGTRILSHYEDYFGVDFPLPKQDMIAVPDFSAGAMENWGLIIYRETAMLYEPGVSSEGNLQRVDVVVAHELAHQWFGDLVTMLWWDDLWLNEGFASFVEYMGVDFLHPDWKMFEQFGLELYDVFDVDSLVTSHPIYVPVHNPDEINEIFDTISYGKGAAVIQMLRFVLGEETFKFGIQKYLKSRQYSNADHNDLWHGLQEQADSEGKKIQVKEVMDTWILQMNYPVVKVTRSANGKIHITQHRYLTDKNATDPGKYPSPFGYVWKIPFTYTTDATVNFNISDKDVIWLETEDKEVDGAFPNGWILGNVEYYGVYRVTYDDDNWMALIEQLKNDHKVIHVLNRGQLINDAFALAKAKELSMDTALKTLDYLDNEDAYVPWVSASRELGYIRDMLSHTEAFGAFQRFMLKKVEGQYSRLGLNDTDANHLESYLRSSIVGKACAYGNKDCINTAQQLFKMYMDHPDNNPISPGVKSAVYCTAVRDGGEAEWDFVFQQYQTAMVQAEKVRLLSAMSCTSPIWMKLRMLRLAMDPAVIRTQDADNIFGYIASDPVGQSVAWNFFRSNWDDIFKTYGGTAFTMSSIIEGVTDSFNTELQLQQLEEFQAAHPDFGTGARAVSQAIERTQANIKWMEENYSIVAAWLAKY